MSRTLYVMVGLPRSGKTTIARKISQEAGCPMVNLDAFRWATYGRRYYQRLEPLVWQNAYQAVEALFIGGHDRVIVDCCNVTEVERAWWKSPHWRVIFIEVLTEPEKCIYRAVDNRDPEIIPVIWRMAGKYEIILPHETEGEATKELTPMPVAGGPERERQ